MKNKLVILCFFALFNVFSSLAQGYELKVFTKLNEPFLLYVDKEKVTPEFITESPIINGKQKEVKIKIVFQNGSMKNIKRKILTRNPYSERYLKVVCQIAIGKKGKINLGRSVTQITK